MKRFLQIVFVVILTALPLAAQSDIAFDSNADLLKPPANIHLGEVGGVATNSKGDIFVYTRTGHPTITIGTARPFAHGGSRLFQFDKTGKYVREIGKDSYGFMVAQQVRIDPQDNIWIVDQMTSMVMKFDPQGQVQFLLGRKAESERVPALPPGGAAAGGRGGERGERGGAEGRGGRGAEAPAAEGGGRGRGGPPGAGAQQDVFARPTDVAWDSNGNIYVADGYGNARVAKFDKTGRFVKSWGQRGSGQGQFNVVHGIVIDAQNNIYVADTGNKRIQVFDSDGTFKTQFTNIGSPAALCITPGPRQVIYSSNSNPPDDIDTGGEIYKLDLTGKVLGKFGKAGKQAKEFGTVNQIDCRTENDLLVGEIGNWRVQKLTLHP
jgi:DNA-binding beta-propeller fold protein YncE